MRIRTTAQVRALGLLHCRAWRLDSERPLLSTEGLTAEQVSSAYDPEQPIPVGYRKLLAELGHPTVVPAGERLRELVATRGWKSHGAVVDAVTVATLRHGGGIGLHGSHGMQSDDGGDLLVARASGGERIVPAFSSKSRPVPTGDLIYGISQSDSLVEPFAWLGRRDCDSAGHQLREDGCKGLLVVLGCPGEDASHSEAIGRTVAEVLATVRDDVTMTPVPLMP